MSPAYAASAQADYSFLLDCVRHTLAGMTHPSRPLPLPPPAVSWPDFLVLAKYHEVVPLAQRALAHSSLIVPESVSAWLHSQCKTITAQNLRLASELTELIGLFQAAKVDAVAFKGPALSSALYHDLSLRQVADLDIFADRSEIRAILRLLLDRGYVLSERTKSLSPDEIRFLHKDLELLHPGSGIHLELHWSACEPFFDRKLSSLMLWQAPYATQLLNRSVPMPTPEDLLLLLSLHGARHRWDRLKWICDIACLFRAFPAFDWDLALAKAKKLSRRRMVLLAILLASELGPIALPFHIEQLIAREHKLKSLVRRIYATHHEQTHLPGAFSREAVRARGRMDSLRLQTRDTVAGRLLLIADVLLQRLKPNAEDRRYVSLPRYADSLYWLLRPVRLWRVYGVRCTAHTVRETVRAEETAG